MNTSKPIGFVAFIVTFVVALPCSIAVDLTTDGRTTNAAQLVESALRAELEGDLALRSELLFDALDKDNNYPPTNWQLGYMRSQTGDWLSIPQHQQLNSLNPTLLEYRVFREKLADDPAADWRLGEWCTRHDMDDIAAIHYSRVLSSSNYDIAKRKNAMRRLGLQLYRGSLLTEEEIKVAKQNTEDLQRAFDRWLPRMRRWQERANDSDQQSRQVADEMPNVDDPHIVQIMELFVTQSGARFGQVLVTKLGADTSQQATEALVKFAVLSQSPAVRQSATEELRLRDMFDYVPVLLSGLVSPIQTEWSIREAADGSVAYQHNYFQEGATEDLSFESAMIFRPTSPNAPQRNPGDRLGRDIDVARSQLEAQDREREILQTNLVFNGNNERVFEVLEQTTRAQVTRDPNEWRKWWLDYNDVELHKQTRSGFQVQQQRMTRVKLPRPGQNTDGGAQGSSTRTPSGTGSQPVRARARSRIGAFRSPAVFDCFVAGTRVWTETGVEPIESIRVGDRVLAQELETGELSFKPVITTTRRLNVPVLQMVFASDTIACTLGHPVWVNGDGWRMAKNLFHDQQLHSVQGGICLKEVKRLEEFADTYSLVVADFHTYFVGESGILVRDNIYREPTRALVPGLQSDE